MTGSALRRAGLDPILRPRSIAVIGASRDPKKWGYLIPQCLLESGYPGRLVLVNPKSGEALGRRFIPSLREAQGQIDLAVTTLPPEEMERVIDDCVAMKVSGVVLFTSGFAETGRDGAARQEALVRRARAHGLRIVGPNCLGLFNAAARMNLTGVSAIPQGRIGLVAQSGNVCESLFMEAEHYGGGFSIVVSVGNQADLEIHEVMEYLAEDTETAVIVVYIESARSGRTFFETLRTVAKRKPIVVTKGGRTDAGARATVSHTASLAGTPEVYDAIFRQAGVVVVQDLDKLYPVALTLTIAPSARGRRIALVGGGGGPATLMADAVEQMGLIVPAFAPPLQAALRGVLRARSAVGNPVDFAGASEDSFMVYQRCAELVLKDPGIDGLVMFGPFGGYRRDLETGENTYTASARALGKLGRECGKPIVLQTTFGRGDYPGLRTLREEGIPFFSSLDIAARCMAALVEVGETMAGPPARCAPAAMAHAADGRGFPGAPSAPRPSALLPQATAARLLKGRGASIVAVEPVRTANEAASAAMQLGFPVVLKLIEPRASHKTEVGGVRTHLCTVNEVVEAFEALQAEPRIRAGAGDDPVILGVAPMIRGGIEAVVGAVRDATFGPLIMVGTGGLYVETYKDIAFAPAPVSLHEARDLIARTRLGKVLAGARGLGPWDVAALATLVSMVSRLISEEPGLTEVDLNPVFVLRNGAQVADVRILHDEEMACANSRCDW